MPPAPGNPGARPATNHSLGNLYGIFYACVARYIATRLTVVMLADPVPPATLKKAWTGSGKASKLEMWQTARERLGYDATVGLGDDATDALALWHLCREGVVG